ncbi:uncharacterized protein LOC132725554 [Ruditapes philippinarum]|uniref:uncharacterized protein LOC132725554 n=1 Tax=Ruditapes philippinarum TaxID=129788 RepID=UPI00295C0758|nr:uncharacterized protein LOC132725554 [Ruditapes philippinarum]
MQKNMKEMFEFGTRCTNCKEVYCQECFVFECNICRQNCNCQPNDCKCKTMNDWIKEKINEAKYLLVSQEATSNCIDVALNYDLILHGDVVFTLKVVMHKLFDNIKGTKGPLKKNDSPEPVNHMEISVDINGDLVKKFVSKQETIVNLPNINDIKIVAVYGGEDRIERHNTCLDKLNSHLEQRGMILEFTENLSETLDKNEDPLLVISLIHSRPVSDVRTTLSGIKEIYHKRVILVLLHFKVSDMRIAASEITKEFDVFDAVDYFQNQEYGKDKKVTAEKAIWTAVDKYEKLKNRQLATNVH